MNDLFKAEYTGLTSPGTRHFVIQPSDDEDLPWITRVIYCEVAGTIVVRDKDGTELPYTLGVGDRIDFRAVRVLATGTTGTFYGWF